MHLRSGSAEPSRETGIPRIGVVSTAVAPGAGGNVASNLASLGVGPRRRAGRARRRWLRARAHALAQCARHLYRSFGSLRQGPHLHLHQTRQCRPPEPRTCRASITSTPGRCPIPWSRKCSITCANSRPASIFFFVSDQADTRQGGVVTASVRTLLEEISVRRSQKIVWVDSRIRIERFRNMILKPNEHEASAASIGLFGEIDYHRLADSRRTPNCCL